MGPRWVGVIVGRYRGLSAVEGIRVDAKYALAPDGGRSMAGMGRFRGDWSLNEITGTWREELGSSGCRDLISS